MLSEAMEYSSTAHFPGSRSYAKVSPYTKIKSTCISRGAIRGLMFAALFDVFLVLLGFGIWALWRALS